MVDVAVSEGLWGWCVVDGALEKIIEVTGGSPLLPEGYCEKHLPPGHILVRA